MMDGDFEKEYRVLDDDHNSEQTSCPIEDSSSLRFDPNQVKERVSQCSGDSHPNEQAWPTVENLESHDCEGFAHQKDRFGDAAAIVVWLYLLLVSSLLVGTVVIGSLVIVKYGFVIFLAVVAAAGASAIVAGTLFSVITGDTTLTNARSTVNAWHVVFKDAILKEIHHFTKDLTAYSDGTLLLTFGQTEEFSSHHQNENGTFEQDLNNQNHTATFKRKPKSVIFRFVVSPITKIGNLGRKNSSSSSKTKSHSWLRKKKQNGMSSGDLDSSVGYVPPIV